MKNVANLIGTGRFEAASQPEPWRRSAPGRAPSGQGNVRRRRQAPVPGGASARSGRGIRRLCVLGAFSVTSVVSRCLPLRLCGEHSKSRLARCQQELPGPTKPDRPLQNLHHKSRITNHESRITGHESPAYVLRTSAGRPLTSHSSNPYTPGNRNHRNSLKTHADALFYSLHSPGFVHTVFILKGSAN